MCGVALNLPVLPAERQSQGQSGMYPGHSLVKDKAEIWHPDLAIKN